MTVILGQGWLQVPVMKSVIDGMPLTVDNGDFADCCNLAVKYTGMRRAGTALSESYRNHR
jgi:hypothetical protein